MNKALLISVIALLLGAGGQLANAGVYGASYLKLDDITVSLTDGEGGAVATVNSFNFNTTNTAYLSTFGGAIPAICGGTPATNNCEDGAYALDAEVNNAPGSSPFQGENTFINMGPGGDQYSHADSVIYTAQLVNGVPTNTEQVAQAEIQTADTASANSTLSSGNDLTLHFTISEDGATLTYSFEAASWIEADTNLPGGQTGIAQSDIITQVQLSRSDGGIEFVQWKPQGTDDNDCVAVAVGCAEDADEGDLNDQVNASGESNNETNIVFEGSMFKITVTGMSAGDYSLTLSAVTKTNLSREGGEPIPVPGTGLLFGLGLLGMIGARRKFRRA